MAKKLSDKEMEMLAYSWQCFKGGAPEIDYEKLSGLVGHSNPASTRNAMARIKKTLSEMVPAANVSSETDGATPATSPAKKQQGTKATGRKRKQEDEQKDNIANVKKEIKGEDDDDMANMTSSEAKEKSPAKKARRNTTPKKTKSSKSSASTDNADDVNMTHEASEDEA